MARANIYLYTGEGVGKTTSALGLALRAVGQNKKVVIIQFLKGRKDIGEWKIKKRLKPNYEIYQFGRKEFVNPKKLQPIDYKLAEAGMAFARKIIQNKKPDLLILDEVNLAVAGGLISSENVIALLNLASSVSPKTSIVLTGRYAPPELIKNADFVNRLIVEKMPKKVPTIKGIHY